MYIPDFGHGKCLSLAYMWFITRLENNDVVDETMKEWYDRRRYDGATS
jgi:hypothetical protein